MTQTQKPQLIVLHEGVFRPAQLVPYSQMQDLSLGINGNVTLIGERISPHALTPVSSVYLGPRKLVDSEIEPIVKVLQESELP